MKYIYIAFHKPYGVLSQFTPDHPGQSTLGEYSFPKEVYTIGRLDRDSEGLIILTNDGQLKHSLLDPKFGHERTYLVQVENIPDEKALNALRSGVQIKGHFTAPAKVELLTIEPSVLERDPPIRERKNIPTSWLEITLTEGKNRQVRKMTAAVGFPTLRLIRKSFGKIQLGDLELGQWIEIDRKALV